MSKIQFAEELKTTDKRCKRVQNEYESVTENPFLSAFYDRYHQAFNMTKRRGDDAQTARPFQAPYKPLGSQEQEQEQEQEYISPEQQEVAQGSKPLFDNSEQEPQALETLTLDDKSMKMLI